MASERRAVRVKIVGRVQGVNFRAWARNGFERLGLDGWVADEADGSVAALLAGSSAECGREWIARLHQGPPAAAVSSVTVEEADRGRGSGRVQDQAVMAFAWIEKSASLAPPLSCRTSPPEWGDWPGPRVPAFKCRDGWRKSVGIADSQSPHLRGRCPAGQRGATSSAAAQISLAKHQLPVLAVEILAEAWCRSSPASVKPARS